MGQCSFGGRGSNGHMHTVIMWYRLLISILLNLTSMVIPVSHFNCLSLVNIESISVQNLYDHPKN